MRSIAELRTALQRFGRTSQRNLFESQHRQGMYDFLYSIDEIGHYMLIIGYLFYLRPNPAILDVGCGQGRLFHLLQATCNFRRYLGIDVSKTAIRHARQLVRNNHSEFVTADFEAWQPSHTFDTIIFNEALYFSPHPQETLKRYARHLGPDGTLIVSIHEHCGFERIWELLANDFQIRAGNKLQNQRGQVWDVRLLHPCTPQL